ncbi:MAG: hypothetical protein H7239_09680 [Flavobacterium sp.]|nr:hypothetical protein [Flavobacterium sp.]
MKKILIALFLLLSLNFYSQELTCEDFKIGTFLIKIDTEKEPYRITRYENYQVEFVKKNDNENIEFTNSVEWIDDCTYRLKYDEKKMSLNAFQKSINENNGVLVKMRKIKGKYLYFDSFIPVDGKIIKVSGKICKS